MLHNFKFVPHSRHLRRLGRSDLRSLDEFQDRIHDESLRFWSARGIYRRVRRILVGPEEADVNAADASALDDLHKLPGMHGPDFDEFRREEEDVLAAVGIRYCHGLPTQVARRASWYSILVRIAPESYVS